MSRSEPRSATLKRRRVAADPRRGREAASGIGTPARRQTPPEHRISRPHLVLAALLHELRQPLGAIRNLVAGGLHLLDVPDADSDQLVEPLQQIGAEAHRIDGILRNLPTLLFRDEVLATRPANVNRLIRNVARLAAHAAGVDANAITFDLAKRLPTLRLDAVLVRQALLNVMVNGLEAAGRGPGESRVRVASRLTADRSVRISIDDRGSGCPSTAMRRLGEPYYTTKPNGTGLGLWLVRSIVEAHGGDIKVRRMRQAGLSVQLTFRSRDNV